MNQSAFDKCGSSRTDSQCLGFAANGYVCVDGGSAVKCNGINLVDQSKHHIMCPGGQQYV